jgi:hypothetical protein
MQSQVVRKRNRNSTPELDHVQPLAVRWKETGKPKPGNTTTQANRDQDYRDTLNLQVMAKWMNLKKSG